MGDTDSPDFNKARGYLIGFSTVVLLLWFFGADLSSFKLLGNEIKLNENVDNVWAVLAAINAYLWFRLYHRMPRGSFRFDMAMHELYDSSLIILSTIIYKKSMKKVAFEGVKGKTDDSSEIMIERFRATGQMSYLDTAPAKGSEARDNYIYKIREMPFFYRNEIRFTIYVFSRVDGAENHSRGRTYTRTPHRLLAVAVKIYVFAKGILVSPWFADHFVPLILGFLAVCVALYKSWQINHVVNVVFKNSFNQILMSL